MLSVIILIVILLSVNMLRVMAPQKGVFSSVWGPKILRRKRDYIVSGLICLTRRISAHYPLAAAFVSLGKV